MTNRAFTRIVLGASIAFFLMPFTTLTCGGRPFVTLTGLQLATGATLPLESPTSEERTSEGPLSLRVQRRIDPQPLAGLALLTGLLAFGIGFATGKPKRIASSILAGATALALLGMKLHLDQDILRQGRGLIEAHWRFGFWSALLAALLGAILPWLPTPHTGSPHPDRESR